MSEEDEQDATLAPGTVLGPFRIVKLLGRGGMAEVYEAEDRRLERAVALKVLPPSFLHDAGFARRFDQEARAVARLEHPNVVPIYASGIDEGMPWMSMRLLAGGNLGATIARRRLTCREAVQMLRDSASALDYAHSRGIVHRDVKPTNLLLDAAGRVSVGDFGLARILDDGPPATRAGLLVGTPEYMAPEQASGAPVDHRCDIYSLGIVAYELFVGEAPFTAASPMAVLLKHVNEVLPAPPAGAVSDRAMQAIRKATAKEPADRWASASALVDALQEAVDGWAAASHPIVVASQAPRRRAGIMRANAGLRAAAVGVLALALAVAGTWWASRSGAPAATTDVILRPAAEGPARSDAHQVSRAADDPKVPAASAAPMRTPATRPDNIAPVPIRGRRFPASAAFPALASIGRQGTLAIDAPDPEEKPAGSAAIAASETPGADVPTIRTPPHVLVPAVRLRSVDPEYPNVMRAAQIEGDVLLQVTIGPDGRTSRVIVVKSAHPLLDAAARKAVLQYEYAPASRNGDPEASTIRIAVSFRLR